MKKMDYISFMNVIAALSVVFLHVNECFWEFAPDSAYWWSANLIESLFYFAVPVFFMMTGATLLDFFERYDLKTYAVKRVKKTLIPYLVWSLLGLLVEIVLGLVKVEEINAKFLFDGIMNGNLVGIYWFFISLFGCYLSIPVFAAIRPDLKKSIYLFLVSFGFVFNILLPFIVRLLWEDMEYTMNIPVTGGYLFYVIAGYVLSRYKMGKTGCIGIYILGTAGFFVHCYGTYKLSIMSGEINTFYKGYLNLPCVCFSIGVFVFLKVIGEKLMKRPRINKKITMLENYTFEVFLLHLFVLKIIRRVFPLLHYSLLYRLTVPFFVFILIAAGVWMARKIPFVRYILP